MIASLKVTVDMLAFSMAGFARNSKKCTRGHSIHRQKQGFLHYVQRSNPRGRRFKSCPYNRQRTARCEALPFFSFASFTGPAPGSAHRRLHRTRNDRPGFLLFSTFCGPAVETISRRFLVLLMREKDEVFAKGSGENHKQVKTI